MKKSHTLSKDYRVFAKWIVVVFGLAMLYCIAVSISRALS